MQTEECSMTRVGKMLGAVDKYISDAGELTRAQKLIQLITVSGRELEECPASHKYHGSYPGGLIDHTLEVLRVAMGLNRLIHTKLDRAQLAFCALVHDLGKLGDGNQEYYLKNPDESKRVETPYIINKDLVDSPHELRTLYWLNMHGIQLEPTEYQAVFYHAGMYMPGYKEHIRNPEPLTHVLHFADMIASQVNRL